MGGAHQTAGKLLPPEVHATLPESALGSGRLIIIGDVHGCVKELRELLDKAGYVDGEDSVVLVGDLVDKGPYPLEVRGPPLRSEKTFLLCRREFLHGARNVHCISDLPYSRLSYLLAIA